ncbi:MAG: terminase gpA endonuclease subunit [Desulfobulbus sp.]|jgi:phage terminase large subunit GpA-like protein
MIPARHLSAKNRTVRVRSDIPWLPEKYSQRSSRIRILFRPGKGERRVFRRKKRLPPSVWAPKYRRITYGPLRGSYHDPHFMPHVGGMLDAAAKPFVREIVNCKAPQTGGSAAWETMIGWYADNAPGDALIVYPDRDTAKKRSVDYLQPMFSGSARLRGLLTGKEDDQASLRLKLQTMLIYMGWAGSVTSIGNVSVRYLIVDELDKCPEYPARGEATFIELVAERTTAFDRFGSMKIWNSTPTATPSPIFARLNACDVIFDYHVPCPDCGQMQRMEFKRIDFNDIRDPEAMTRERAARYICAACGSLWDDRARDQALRQGQWFARPAAAAEEPPADRHPSDQQTVAPEGQSLETYLRAHRPERVGFHSPAWISPLNSLSKCAAAFLEGLKNEAAMLYFDTQIRAVEHVPYRRVHAEDAILSRRDDRPEGLVPGGGRVAALVAGVDVQAQSFVYSLRAFGWGMDLPSWGVRYGEVDSLRALEQVLWGTPYQDADGLYYPVILTVIDTGGHRASEIYDFARLNPTMVAAYKGASGRQAVPYRRSIIDRYPGTSTPIPGGVELYLCDSGYYKDQLAGKLRIAPGDPGAYRFHAGTGREYATQMCCEYIDERNNWQCPPGRANHFWDCAVMELIAADLLYLKWESGPEPADEEEEPA